MFWNRNNALNYVPKSVIDALRSNFSDAEIATLSRTGTLVEIPAGAALTVEGTVGREALVIVDGSAAVAKEGTHIATIGAGEIIGEMSLISGSPRNATVIASSMIRAYALSTSEFTNLIAAHPELGNRLATIAVKRLSNA